MHPIACLSWKACNKHVLGGAPDGSLFLSAHPSICCAPYLGKHTSCDHNFWYTCVKRWYIQVFFHFCKILIFRVIRGVKGKKVAQNEKSSRAMSQEQCSMWSWFLVRVCKIIVAGGVFVIFSKFCFFELLFGVNGLKWWKVLSDALILGAVHHHCHLCVKW